ncbi:MAG: aspartate/glutamate racemase family protein [Alphaproteobacteria bacterium]|nr:aspartate/glutamate racemase family protein [Alphaproteobacteria bacterium]
MSVVAHGGKNFYGARLGILMLETRFPRIPGDMGNAGTWPFPVLFKRVRGATPKRVVEQRAVGLGNAFLDAAAELVAEGADGITTTCGFLSLFQDQLARHTRVPVATSTLMMVPLVQRLLPPDQKVGIITVSQPSLTVEHLTAVGVDPATPVIGTEGGRELTRVLIGDEPSLDVALAEQDLIEASGWLLERHPEIGAFVFECANMAPYAKAVRDRHGRPVYDIYSFVTWFHSGLQPRDFSPLWGRGPDWRER